MGRDFLVLKVSYLNIYIYKNYGSNLDRQIREKDYMLLKRIG